MSGFKTCKIATLTFSFLSIASGVALLNGQTRQSDFPYQAMVIADQAKVHSGPGSVHYRTDELKRDSIVEVYRHDPDGWCAIRPPAGSFSLVPESAVTIVSEGLGVISEDGVQAWVGTQLGTVDVPLWQVKLRADEEIEILGEVSWPNPEGYSTVWYQIAPPAGEFRWIRISDLRLPKNLNKLPEVALADSISTPKASTRVAAPKVASKIPAQGSRRIRDVAPVRQSSFEQADSQPDLSDPTFDTDPVFEELRQDELDLNPPSQNAETVNRGWRQASRPIHVADNRQEFKSAEPFKTPTFDARADKAGAHDTRLNRRGENVRANVTNDGFSNVLSGSQPRQENADDAIHPVTPISGPVSERIRKLEFQLSTEMQQPPARWQLESLLRNTSSIAASTNDVREREHAQRLQQKIRNCVSIQSRYGAAFANRQLTEPVSSQTPAVNAVQLGTTYDAYGWLNRLVRDNGRLTPTYVLEDGNGKITHHVGASPGLNLQRYLKQRVGIMGRRGFHRDLGLNHVTAERVVVLDKSRLAKNRLNANQNNSR